MGWSIASIAGQSRRHTLWTTQQPYRLSSSQVIKNLPQHGCTIASKNIPKFSCQTLTRHTSWTFTTTKDCRGIRRSILENPTNCRWVTRLHRTCDFNIHATAWRRSTQNAKILVTLRNPIERGYSHYWHEKKKRKINYDFREAIGNNVDIFDDWIATGFYYTHLKHLQTLFPKDQICVMLYEDLLDSPQQFCQNVFRFLDIDPTFLPSVVNNRVNKAWYKPTLLEMIKNLRAGRAIRESEYQRGIDPQFRSQLREVFRDEIACLSALLSRDLSHWN